MLRHSCLRTLTDSSSSSIRGATSFLQLLAASASRIETASQASLLASRRQFVSQSGGSSRPCDRNRRSWLRIALSTASSAQSASSSSSSSLPFKSPARTFSTSSLKDMETLLISIPPPAEISGDATSKAKLSQQLAPAVRLLSANEVVAIPTETVYGLAANALSSQAVQKIFQAKNRPSDNPLIVHVSSFEMLRKIIKDGVVPPKVQTVLDRFWPGPLTVLLEKADHIPDEVTCGHPTVAVRMPAHPTTLMLIEQCGFPLAAPSANSSGRPSPTTAQHVMDDLGGKIACIVDSGRCSVGLESTVVDILRNPPAILRPGGLTYESLQPLLPDLVVYRKDFVDSKLEARPTTPGMKYKHYSPNAAVILFEHGDDIVDEQGQKHRQEQKALEDAITREAQAIVASGKSFAIIRNSQRLFPSSSPSPSSSASSSTSGIHREGIIDDSGSSSSRSSGSSSGSGSSSSSSSGENNFDSNRINESSGLFVPTANSWDPRGSHLERAIEDGIAHPERLAHELFHALRYLDEKAVDFILIEGVPERQMGVAVMNRLRKAATRIIQL